MKTERIKIRRSSLLWLLLLVGVMVLYVATTTPRLTARLPVDMLRQDETGFLYRLYLQSWINFPLTLSAFLAPAILLHIEKASGMWRHLKSLGLDLRKTLFVKLVMAIAVVEALNLLYGLFFLPLGLWQGELLNLEANQVFQAQVWSWTALLGFSSLITVLYTFPLAVLLNNLPLTALLGFVATLVVDMVTWFVPGLVLPTHLGVKLINLSQTGQSEVDPFKILVLAGMGVFLSLLACVGGEKRLTGR